MSSYASITNLVDQSQNSLKFGSFWSKRERCLVVALVIVSVFFLAVLIAALVTWTKPGGVLSPIDLCTNDDCIDAAYIIASSRNESVLACTDFYHHACGRWPDNNHIPDDESRWTTFDIIDQRLLWDMKSILEEGSAHLNLTSTDPIDNVYISYSACMDEEKVEALHLEPLQNLINTHYHWPLLDNSSHTGSSITDIKTTIASLLPYGVNFFFAIGVTTDLKNSSAHIVGVDQPTFGMPRSYLVGNGSATEIAAYKQLIKDTALLLNSTNTNLDSDIDDIVALEMKLANMSSPPELTRLVNRTYNKMTVSELQAITAGGNDTKTGLLPWLLFFNVVNANITADTEVIVSEIDYIKNMSEYLLTSSDVSYKVLQNYVIWRLIKPMLWHTTVDMRMNYFKYQRVLTGVKTQSPRWKSCVEWTNQNLGFALGKPYVEKHFPVTTRAEVESMVHELITAFKQMLDKNVWMDKTLLAEVKNKADKMKIHVGYPDWIKEKSKLDDYYENMTFPLNVSLHFNNMLVMLNGTMMRNYQRLNEPVDPELWYFTPTIVNAAYSDERNSIEFPAGILQPPFYFPKGPKSINFGSIGAVIGHEITHGFDDQGSLFTWQGNFAPWWDNVTTERFAEQKECFINQYSQFCPAELNKEGESNKTCVNGKNTVGENIADNGGIKEAFLAYKNHIASNGADDLPAGLADLTSEQLFFYAFAQSWCSNYRVEALKNQVENNEHSPPEYRVIGTVANSEDFSEAFKCAAPSKPCVLW